MKILEKVEKGKYIGQNETGVYSGTRFIIFSSVELEEGDVISSANPIQYERFQTLCELCEEVYEGGEDYDERMKQQAVDYICGYIEKEEIEF